MNDDFIPTGEQGESTKPERVLVPEGKRNMFIYRLSKSELRVPKNQINKDDTFEHLVWLELLDEETKAIAKCDTIFIRYYNTAVWTDLAQAGKAEFVKGRGYKCQNPYDANPAGCVGMPVVAVIEHKERPRRTKNQTTGQWEEVINPETGEPEITTYATLKFNENYRPVIKARDSEDRVLPPEMEPILDNDGPSDLNNDEAPF